MYRMISFDMKFVLSLSILNFIQIVFVESGCIVNYTSDIETSPIYAKKLGRYTLRLPFNGGNFLLNEGEQIQALCRTTFKNISYTKERDHLVYNSYNEGYKTILVDKASVNLKCQNNRLLVNNFILKDPVLECNKLMWSIYDTAETYEWCEKNENSKTLLFAAKSHDDHHILAGICFNPIDWSLQTITYNVTSTDQNKNKEMLRDIAKSHLKSYKALGEDLAVLKNNYFDVTESELQKQLVELSKSNSWLELATYENSPIVQGVSYENYFSKFADILNIVWWRNLRLGNWKRFMNTLENYANQNSFQLYAGTSGVVRLPPTSSADMLEIKSGLTNKPIPGYIWTYLTSTDNQNKDFIIVGYNSPFPEWFGIDDIVFCADICSGIPWLKEVYLSFRYATAGIMFCCSTDFVKQTNYLHGFPMDILIAREPLNKANLIEVDNATDISVRTKISKITLDFEEQ